MISEGDNDTRVTLIPSISITRASGTALVQRNRLDTDRVLVAIVRGDSTVTSEVEYDESTSSKSSSKSLLSDVGLFG